VSKSLRLSVMVMLIYAGLLALTVFSLTRAPTSLLPNQDQGYVLVNVQLPDSASVQRTQAIMEHIDKIARGTNGVVHTVGVSGQSFVLGTSASNLGAMFVVLAPFSERTADEYDAVIAQNIQAQCTREIEGATINVFRAPPIRGLSNVGGFQLQTEQRGFVDLDELQRMTDRLVAKANANPAIAGAFTQFRAHTPQLYMDIDRAKVESLHVPISDVFTTLQVEMGGLYVNQFNKFGRTWQVQLQAAPQFRTTTGPLREFQVRNMDGQMVPLGTVARVKRVTGPLMVMRYNMYISAPVNGTAAPGVSSGTIIDEMTRIAQEADVPIEWTQLSYLEVQAGNVGLLIFALGTALVYLVLAGKYESWRLPFAVILVVPLCMLATVTGMTIAGLPVDIFVQIGLLVLVGLASKNAILIVEFGRQLRDDGKELHEATVEASTIRFRPIIMTSLAFIFGVLPLVIARGAGAEMRQSLGTAVFSGMIGVTLFGIFLTPVFFYVIDWLAERGTPRPVDHAHALAPLRNATARRGAPTIERPASDGRESL
jgi:multidrug efflux pump